MDNVLRTYCYICVLVLAFLMSCNATRVASYDQYAYQKAIEIKTMTSRLMDRSIDSYENHLVEVEGLVEEIEKMKSYEEKRPDNEISLQMWQVLADENGFSIAGFLKKWKERGQFSKTFAQEAKKQILEGLDVLIRFEAKKDPESKSALQKYVLTNQ